MRETTDPEEIGGKSVRIGDCFVWSEIYYLYSATDYREYIRMENAALRKRIDALGVKMRAM